VQAAAKAQEDAEAQAATATLQAETLEAQLQTLQEEQAALKEHVKGLNKNLSAAQGELDLERTQRSKQDARVQQHEADMAELRAKLKEKADSLIAVQQQLEVGCRPCAKQQCTYKWAMLHVHLSSFSQILPLHEAALG
jgi:chromosome segregation ATPase